MATFADGLQQQTNEIHTYTIDYTSDLPSGGTVTGGTATHLPPSGSVASITVSVTSPYVFVTVPVLAVVGLHYIDVLATFSNSDKSAVRLPIHVVYPTPIARVGMVDLITELRSLTEANVTDYTIAGIPFWNDAQLQDILDVHREDLRFVALQAYPNQVQGGSLVYYDYKAPAGYLEQTTGGSQILWLQDSTGATLGTALWNADYRRGMFTFVNTTGGTAVYMTGRSYDLNAAAADVWRRKVAHVSTSAFNFSTDNHSVSRAQVYDHALEMVSFFENMSGDGLNVVQRFRSDM